MKVPRFTRTIELVVNIPAPAQPTQAPAPKPPKPTGWRRFWIFVKIAGPALAAVAALVISILTLVEQESADRTQGQADAAAASASQRQQAAQVSYLDIRSMGPPINISLLVENLGTIPAYSPSFSFTISGGFEAPGSREIDYVKAQTFNIGFSDIPACSSATVSLYSAILAALREDRITVVGRSGTISLSPTAGEIDVSGPYLVVTLQSMTFSDGDSWNWAYSTDDGLRPASLPPDKILDSSYTEATYKPANGCA
jgi:hypothetical protein